MKKIVALVLALVLALSLATVAFAATTYYVKGTEGGYYELTAVKATAKNGAGKIAGYTAGPYSYVKCEKGEEDAQAVYTSNHPLTGDEPAFYVVKVDTLEYTLTGTAVKAEKWSCTTDEHAAGYYSADTEKYYEDSETSDVYMMVDGELVEVAEQTDVIKGSHLLYQYKTEAVSTGVYVYKCAFCGKTFNGAMAKAYAGTNYVEYAVDPTIFAVLSGDRVIDGWVGGRDMAKYWNKVVDDLGLNLADIDLGTLYLVGEAAEKADTGVKSAQTFDAGVALYAGMALMSVAGSAVVIGKKKEF